MLQDARAEEENRFKLLLLGPGESGKSTVVKQVKLIYKGGMNDKEKEEFVAAIRRNAVESMQTLMENMFKLGLNVEDPSLQEAANELADIDSTAELTPELGNKISMLWNDPGVQATFARRDEFWILDACRYYFQEVHRLAEEDYLPTEEDILMTRVRTTGIVLTEFQEGPHSYTIVDVGGQRSERRKWIHCFDDVKAIIFLVGLSGYHQVMFEDNSQLMLHESLTLFEDIVKNPLFKDTPIFLFLNKKDLFEDMISEVSLRTCFPEYEGPDGEVAPAIEFISSKFKAVMAKFRPNYELNVHVIAARVRMDMKMAFADVKDQVKAHYQKRR